jgi:DNA-binding winged helix-turn-helix (wHTH) protein
VFGSFILDIERRSLLRDGRPVPVSSKGMLLLQALVSSAGAPVSKAQLMEAGWPGAAVEESNLSVQIAALRKLLGPQSNGREWIATVPRVGYRFVGDVQVLDRNDAGRRRDAPTQSPRRTGRPLRSCRSSMSAATRIRSILRTALQKTSSRR